jgi:hypothetical protein
MTIYVKKKLARILRFFIPFLPAAYIAGALYRDLFLLSEENKLSFLLWGFPLVHCVVVCMQLISMGIGWPYFKVEEKSLAKIRPVPFFQSFPAQLRFRLFFYSILLNNRARIMSGLFVADPSFILIYRDMSDNLKILSPGCVLIKVMWLLGNLIVLQVLNFILL